MRATLVLVLALLPLASACTTTQSLAGTEQEGATRTVIAAAPLPQRAPAPLSQLVAGVDIPYESFTLANMVPQDGDHNRHIWAPIEGEVRKMAKKEGQLYVITGPAFLGNNLRKVGNVLVPSHMYKVVYSPRQKMAAAWFTENRAHADIQVIPVAELERIVGIEFLPSLSQQQKERMLRLPKIKQKKQAKEPRDFWSGLKG